VSWAVHGFESKYFFLHFKLEHVLSIMVPVSRSLPQFAVVDIWRDHFLVAPPVILYSNELNEGVVEVGPSRKEKAAARTQFMEEK